MDPKFLTHHLNILYATRYYAFKSKDPKDIADALCVKPSKVQDWMNSYEWLEALGYWSQAPSRSRPCGRTYLNTHKSHQHGKTHETPLLKKVRPAHFSDQDRKGGLAERGMIDANYFNPCHPHPTHRKYQEKLASKCLMLRFRFTLWFFVGLWLFGFN